MAARRFKLFSRCEGAAAVEFAIILPILIFIIFGGMDLGHMFYIEHLATNASREGARYGVKYKINPSTQKPYVPSAFTPSIENYVLSAAPTGLGYAGLLGSDATVTPGGTGYTGGLSGQILTVTVTAQKHWWVLSSFNFYGWLPLTNPQTLTATTAMTLER
jgi:Flp pilus assembly protein TadG